MDGSDVDRAVAEMVRVLAPHQERDWSVPAGSLEWSCRETAAHVAHDLLAYAGQLAGRPEEEYLPFDLAVRPEASPRHVLDVVTACGGLLGSAARTAGPEARGWHWGPCDRTGFAAMGTAETLLHTHDITQGLHVPWRLPETQCSAILRRLFPEAPPGDPAQVLLWCTGRGELPGLPRRTSWVWRAALDS